MTLRYSSYLALSLLIGAAGCGVGGGEVVGDLEQGAIVSNGMRLNGMRLNGVRLNGTRLNGVRLNGLRLNGVRLNGTRLNGVRLNGTRLNGTRLNGTRLNGADFAGATVEAELSNGDVATIVIDRVVENAVGDIDHYYASIQTDDGPIALCGHDAAGNPEPATALENLWNEDTGDRIDSTTHFTLACNHGALYKCADYGYKPWRGLTDHHQACTRMLRADYCGNGTSYTHEDVLIDIYDDVGVQKSETKHDDNWAFEAEWNTDGAICLAHTRVALSSPLPQCIVERMNDKKCGKKKHFKEGTLLMNRSMVGGGEDDDDDN